MKHEFRIIDSERIELILVPEFTIDRINIDSIGTIDSARIKRNGVLTITFDIPKAPLLGKSATPAPRPPEDVRDSGVPE